ncbi:MAG TPA: Mur ligase family protein, partial [Dehalococcoidia bacterium]|nr:Mur ligase family protein [Dehalococcoidia bacterium]
MNYAESIAYLRSLTDMERDPAQAFAPVNFDLRRMESLLARLGSPQRGRRTIHVAGSKGKGSITTMVAAILREAGHRAGLYTSPHLHRYEERFSVDHEIVGPERFAALVATVSPALEAESHEGHFGEPSTFEALTAMAFVLFAEEGCDVQVLEVGLGGRLDATNVELDDKLCVISPIGLEHAAILGDTVAAIAAEKAAIIGSGDTAVMSPQRESAAEVVRARCAETGVTLHEVSALVRARPGALGLEGREVVVQTTRQRYEFRSPLLALEQVHNAAAAVLTSELFLGDLEPSVVKRALSNVRILGRQELIKRKPPILVDVAHSEDSVRSLVNTLNELGVRNVTLVFAPLADKRIVAMAETLAPLCGSVIVAPAPHPRAAEVSDVVAAFAY